jgi:sulfhydrogenase subunit beta (sulfur reductase)
MKQYTIHKQKMNDLIKTILKKYRIIAPVDKDNITSFKEIKKPDELTLNFKNSKIPPKSIFFPQTETLFKFSTEKNIKLENPDDFEETILFGIRPCDAKSLEILKNVFVSDYEDNLFLSKIKNTIFIGLSCVEPALNCFCTSVDGSPCDSTGLDILLTDIGDKYFVDIYTKKGEHLLDIFKDFKYVTKNDKDKKATVVKNAENKIKRYMQTQNIEKILDKIFESSYWEKIAKRCLGCGICTYLCPTCHCFDIQDEKKGEHGARIRVWDSCMYSEYTKQASGYNPRPNQMNRIRNRVYHKFSYFPKNSKVFGCVGCGRCITECPVNIDIIETINDAGQVKK